MIPQDKSVSVSFADAGILPPGEDEEVRSSSSAASASRQRSAGGGGGRLSVVSKQYGVGGKGYLDETEQQLRNLDTENAGHLSNEKVYALMQHHIADQRKLFQMIPNSELVQS